MKAVMLQEPEHADVTSAPEPDIGAHDVRIRVRAAGICGTDVHIYRGEYEATYPLIPGHEFSGKVVAVGSDVQTVNVGDRVTADPNVPCNRCDYCQRNQPNQCRNLRAIGVTQHGAFAEYVVAPEGNVFPIDDITYPAAALIEPLACVVWGLMQVEPQPGDDVVIFGAGPMGCLLVQTLKRAGAARITVVDKVESRLKLAAQLGANEVVHADDTARLHMLAPDGFDIVTDATGIPTVIEGLVNYARPRAKLWIFGVAPVGTRVSFPPYEVFRKDLKIIGSFAVNRTFPQSITLIKHGAVKVEPLISHQMPLDAFAEGMRVAQEDPERMKVQFTVN